MSATQPLRLGFVGLGLMGTAMALRLRERGWPLTVWNLEPAAMSPVVAAGASEAASPAAVARAADIVLVCVLDTAAVESVVFGAGGVASGARPGLVLVDHSTTDPAATRDMAARLRATCEGGWVDAPVSGGPIVARAGGLTVMAGGADPDVARATPVMRDLSANFTHLGPAGAGQVAKTINQAIVCANYVILAEALALAEAGGLNAALLPQCLAGGHADSTLLRAIYPQMQARAFVPPRSYARQLLKDLKSVAAFAAGHGLAVPMVQAALERYAAHVAAGHGLEDSTSIIRQYERGP